MNPLIKAFLICLVATPLMAAPGTFSYFSDEETSGANIFTAGEWTPEADCLEIITNKTHITGDGRKIFDTEIRNKCSYDITVESMWIGWTSPGDSNLVKISIEGVRWEGCISSEDMAMVPCDVNYIVLPYEPSSDTEHILLNFDNRVTKPTIGDPLVMLFIMSDGSEKYKLWPEQEAI